MSGLLICITTGCVTAGDDLQWWNRITIQKNLGQKTKAYLDEEFRIGDDIGELYFHRTNFGIRHDLSSRFYYSVDYWYSTQIKGNTRIEEHKPHFSIAIRSALRPFRFEIRNRLEWRMIEHAERSWRNRVRLKATLNEAGISLKPYIADELFILLDEKEIDQNRIYLGATIALPGPFSLDCYYLLDMKNRDTWIQDHVIGTAFGIG